MIYKDRRRYVWWKCNHCGQTFPTIYEHAPGYGAKPCRVCRCLDWAYAGHGRKGERLVLEKFKLT